MRYRSATVADSHGLPLNLKRYKKNKRTRAGSANTPTLRNLFICAFFAFASASRQMFTLNSTLAHSRSPLFSPPVIPSRKNARLPYRINVS